MKKSLRIAGALAATGFAASVLAPVERVFAGDQLTITAWGGASQAADRKAFFEPFSKATGVKITEDEYNGDIAKVRAMVESKTVSWDVLDASGGGAVAMCDQGLLEIIDWKKIGLDRAKFIGADQNDCGVPFEISATVLVYDKDRLVNGPKAIADLFDLKKFPGKRGLWKSPHDNLEWALIADGVSVKDVYKVLNTPEGVDRAFNKLDTIKKDIIWWTAGAQPVQLLASGQVVMTAAWNGRIYDAVKNSGKHFEIVWDGQQWGIDYWVIPKGSPRLDDAYKFLTFAGSPQLQANFAKYISYGPGNKDALALVDPAVLPYLPTAPENMSNALKVNTSFWADKGDELDQRFATWLAK